MRLLITGGAGFIGSAVIRKLLREESHEVLNFDKLTYAANLSNLEAVLPHPRYRFAKGDICDTAFVQDTFEEFDPDAVMHLAAESHVDRSIEGPGQFINTNIVGTYTLLQAARGHYAQLTAERQRAFRFHHISTDEVFGSLGPGDYFTEKTAYAPNSPYSASKASSDMLARAWHHTFGLPVLISNCSNNYGPFQFPEKLIPVVILSALSGRPIPVYGNGANIRDWLHVDDHASALIAILTRGRPGESYNVGGNNELTNLELVKIICRTLDELIPDSPHRPHEGLITFVKDRPGHDQRYAIDARKIAEELNWQPSIDVAAGINATVKWYLDNRKWWHDLLPEGSTLKRLGLVET